MAIFVQPSARQGVFYFCANFSNNFFLNLMLMVGFKMPLTLLAKKSKIFQKLWGWIYNETTWG